MTALLATVMGLVAGPGSGASGSDGTRSVSGMGGATRKGSQLSESYGVWT